MTERLSDLPPDATLADLRAWLERANVRTLAACAATQEEHRRLVQMLGVLVIEARKEQWKLSKEDAMIDTNALYHDSVSGRKFVRIRRKLDTEFRLSLILDGHKMLAFDDMADLHDMARGWIALDETAVETNAGDFRNMAQLTQVDRYGQPVCTGDGDILYA